MTPDPGYWTARAEAHYDAAVKADRELRTLYATTEHRLDGADARRVAALHQRIGFGLKAGNLAALLATARGEE